MLHPFYAFLYRLMCNIIKQDNCSNKHSIYIQPPLHYSHFRTEMEASDQKEQSLSESPTHQVQESMITEAPLDPHEAQGSLEEGAPQEEPQESTEEMRTAEEETVKEDDELSTKDSIAESVSQDNSSA